MNKKIYILTLLAGSCVALPAQQIGIAPEGVLPDTISMGYQLATDMKQSSYCISGVNSKAFANSPAVDITKALYGKIAGLNVYQGSGSSADNVSTLSFHGKTPLVLIDGYPRSVADVTTSEIESCYLLKDAAAMALYGVRGANGVLVITTKRGRDAKPKLELQYTTGFHTQFRAPEFADAYTYAQSVNTALLYDQLSPRYNENELEAFKTGIYPYEYPNVDWWKNTMNDLGYTNNLKFSVRGGNSRFRYFTAIDYYRDKSMLKENKQDNRYSTKPTDTRLSLRTNIDVNITSTTYMKVGLLGKLQELNGTASGRSTIFNHIYKTPAAAFPIKNAEGIYGGSSVYGANNPVGLLVDKGHIRNIYGTLMADMSLKQDLSGLTEGLAAELSVSFDNIGGMNETSSKEYRYASASPSILPDGTLVTSPVIYGKDSQELGHSQPFESLLMRSDFQAKVSYDRTFSKHQISGALIYDMQSNTVNGRNKSFKNQSMLFNASYVYDNKYVLNGVVNYSGSSYLPEGDKFCTYPAVSAAWIASNEAFLKKVEWIDLLKVRASYGISGWDGTLTHELWRQSFGSGPGYNFGANAGGVSGGAEGTLPVVGLTAEKSEKVTAGFDFVALNNRLSFTLDGFYENRSKILVPGSNITSGIIGIGVGQLCEGIHKYKGFDASVNWNDHVGKFNYSVGANVSYMNSEVVNENQAYQEYDYLYRMGDRVGQFYGLEAVGFFENQMDINNSPVHSFTDVKPGDVKYRDQNGDNIIDEKDVVRMFGSSMPRFYFGINLNFEYKGFELGMDFQGLTGKTVSLLESDLYKPLVNNGNISNTFLQNEVYWTAENKSVATMPRLTTMNNENNYRASSLWYRDGSFLKLRNLIVAYTFKKDVTKFADIKVFVQGNNLFSLDNIGFADPEQLQTAYPSTRSYWAGIKLNF